MFTGLIEDVGRIVAVESAADARRLTVATRLADGEMAEGDSLAIDGVCLTVVRRSAGQATALAASETLARTTLGSRRAGDEVNLERALRLGDRLGGHIVSGHVDGRGRILRRAPRGEAVDVAISCASDLLRYVVAKGSIAVDGISLTVNRVDDAGLEVSLIPHTRGATTLHGKPLGAEVNLEVDVIGKYVERLLGPHRGGSLTLDKLRENGFV